MTRPVDSRERAVLRRTRAALAVNLAAAAGLVVLLMSAIAFVVSTSQQNTATERYIGFALGQDSGGVKYSCLWLFTMPASPPGPSPSASPAPSLSDAASSAPVTMERVEGAAVAPPGFPVLASMRSVAAGGRPVRQIVPGPRTVYLVQTVLVDGQVRQAVFDLAYQHDDNRQMLIALTSAGLGGFVGAAVLGLTLSRRAVRPLTEALDRQQRFVTDASHELRVPLTRLHTRAQLLRETGAELPAPVTTELTKMVRGTRELAEVVDDLLRSAQLGAGARDGDRVDLAALADDIIAAEADRLTELRITAEVQADLGHPSVPGVESSLRRMLSALVDNAIAHSRPGGWVRVTVTPVDDNRAVEMTVADDGVGLDLAARRKIFERFARGTTGHGPRHGLGLALAREVIDRHHGTITATDEPGRGARFVVRLPSAHRGAFRTAPDRPWRRLPDRARAAWRSPR